MMDTNDNIKAIRALENMYGIVLFRMALNHLVDVGTRHLTEEFVEEAVNQIKAKDEADRSNGNIPIMTVDLQIRIVRCAAELAKFPTNDLFNYIAQSQQNQM